MTRTPQRRWVYWAGASIVLGLYCSAGFIASRTEVLQLKLKPGATVDLRLFRIAPQSLAMELWFARKDWNDRRPELGDHTTRVGAMGRSELVNSGKQVRLIVSSSRENPVVFEASPASGFARHYISRTLQPLEPGVPLLGLGFNSAMVTVDAVDPTLMAETAQLAVIPALGFKALQKNVLWLWLWFMWPLFLLLQAAWAGLLVLLQARKSR